MGFAIAQHYKARMKTMTLKICHQGLRIGLGLQGNQFYTVNSNYFMRIQLANIS